MFHFFCLFYIAIMLVPVVFAAALSFSASYGLPQSQQVPLIAQDPFTLPLGPADTPERRSEIKYTRQNFCYGPDIAGHGPYYPVGSVADQMIEVMNRSFFDEQLPWNVEVAADAIKAGQAVSKVRLVFALGISSLLTGLFTRELLPTSPTIISCMKGNGTSLSQTALFRAYWQTKVPIYCSPWNVYLRSRTAFEDFLHPMSYLSSSKMSQPSI